jgi:hypothetical protein
VDTAEIVVRDVQRDLFRPVPAMDNRINDIRRKINALRAEMVRVETTMHDQIRSDRDCTDSALRLMEMRKELASLVAAWRAAGGSERLPTIQERLTANTRPLQKSKAA